MTDTALKPLPPPPSYQPSNHGNASHEVAGSHVFETEAPVPSAPLAGRLPNGRFTHGNPGKPRGARHRTSLAIEQLLEGAAADVARSLIGAAQCGSLDAQKWILNRCAPARKGRTVVLDDFPEIRGPDDIAPALASIAASVADGVISVDEATAAANVLQKFLAVFETAQRLGRGLPENGSQ
jgi:hypothetical protein